MSLYFKSMILSLMLFVSSNLLCTVQIHQAVKKGDLIKVQQLLRSNPDLINLTNNRQRTPLDEACVRGKLNIIQYLFEKGASTFHHSPLLQVIHGFAHPVKKKECVTFLLSKNKNLVDQTNDHGISPLHWSGNELEETIQILLEHGADINAKDKNGFTPLHHYTKWWQNDRSEFLIKKGANIDQKDNLGRTPLHWAAILGRKDKTELLLKHHVDMGIIDNKGFTALNYSLKYSHKDISRLLLKKTGKMKTDNQNSRQADLSKKKFKDGEAMIHYLGSNSWAVETQNHFLIFDYEDWGIKPSEPCLSNGWINPHEIREKQVFLFASYPGVYNKNYTSWNETIKRFKYITGFPPEKHSDETILRSNQTKNIDTITVTTIKTIDGKGMGFLVKADNINIFHGGRHWLSSDKKTKTFKKVLNTITDSIDIAFIPISFVSEVKQIHLDGFMLAAKTLNPKVVLPSGGQGTSRFLYTKAAGLLKKKGFKNKTFCAYERGERFFVTLNQ